MARIYEGMFLIDNAAVREDWTAAKSIVTGTLEKHGGTVHSARRWDERRLAYPMKGRNRATFLLTYFELPAENIPTMRRDFELNEAVLRSLELSIDAIPEGEAELHEAENAADFSVPTPPEDDHVEEPEAREGYGREERRPEGSRSSDREEAAPDGAADAGGSEGSPKSGESAKAAAGDDAEAPEQGTDEAVTASEGN